MSLGDKPYKCLKCDGRTANKGRVCTSCLNVLEGHISLNIAVKLARQYKCSTPVRYGLCRHKIYKQNPPLD